MSRAKNNDHFIAHVTRSNVLDLSQEFRIIIKELVRLCAQSWTEACLIISAVCLRMS